jgi:Bacterial Ig domain
LTPALTQAEEFCPRTLAFTIPGNPGVQVTAVQLPGIDEDHGSIHFTVDVDGNADLRGLFFHLADEAKLAGLDVKDVDGDHPLITNFVVQEDSVINLGQGAEMSGAASPFDVGIRWGSPGPSPGSPDYINFPVDFILSNTANNLSLDDIAHQLFGARLDGVKGPLAKITITSPAPPDAHDDAFTIFEDGASGLGDPSHDPVGQLFEVIKDSDTDADGDALTVTDFHDGPSHGTVQIVDGADDDDLPGDAVLYTPDADYSGTDSFVYCVSDGHGSQDNATVNVSITGVADIPDLTYEVVQGDTINVMLVNVTATVTDADGSESITSIEASDLGLPSGVAPAGDLVEVQPGEFVRQFVLTVPTEQDLSFDIALTATSQEDSDPFDTEIGTATAPIHIEFNHNETAKNFVAQDQSIWESGSSFQFTDDRFIGIDEPFHNSGLLNVDGSVKVGFQSALTFNGGEIDANVNFDITVNTTYNETTDFLLIDPTAAVTGGSFQTFGPSGSYVLDAIFNYALSGDVTVDLGILGSYELIDFDVGPSNNQFEILNFTSDDLEFELPLPDPLEGSVAWPNIDTNGSLTGSSEFTSDGESNNFLTLGLDVDQTLADIFLGGVNPFDLGFDIGVIDGSLELLDLDLNGGLNILQQFSLLVNQLDATMVFEDNVTQVTLDFGTPILLPNASSLDANHDGTIAFTLQLTPDASLTNDTDLGVNVGYDFDFLKVDGHYDIGIDSGDFTLGPLFHRDGTLPIADVSIYDATFGLAFQSDQYGFVV